MSNPTTPEWRHHSYGYGPNHNVCWDCGAEHKDRYQNSNCPGFVKDETVRRRIEAAAVERGYEKGVEAVAGQLQETYDKIRESDPKLHRYLWDFARNLPSKR